MTNHGTDMRAVSFIINVTQRNVFILPSSVYIRIPSVQAAAAHSDFVRVPCSSSPCSIHVRCLGAFLYSPNDLTQTCANACKVTIIMNVHKYT